KERDRKAGDRGVSERRPRRGKRQERRDETDVTRLYVALGRRAGVRPADLVGAIANEAGIDARAVGSIEIADRFSIVEVPDEAAGRCGARSRTRWRARGGTRARRAHCRHEPASTLGRGDSSGSGSAMLCWWQRDPSLVVA